MPLSYRRRLLAPSARAASTLTAAESVLPYWVRLPVGSPAFARDPAMPKNKSHKGLLKRVRITKSGKIKLHRAFGRHLRSHKSGRTIRKYRRATYAASSEAKRLGRVLLQRVRGRGHDRKQGSAVETTAAQTPPVEPKPEPADTDKPAVDATEEAAHAAHP